MEQRQMTQKQFCMKKENCTKTYTRNTYKKVWGNYIDMH